MQVNGGANRPPPLCLVALLSHLLPHTLLLHTLEMPAFYADERSSNRSLLATSQPVVPTAAHPNAGGGYGMPSRTFHRTCALSPMLLCFSYTYRKKQANKQTHTQTQTHTHTHTQTQIHTHTHTDTQTYTHKGTQTHTHIRAHTHTHTHTQRHTKTHKDTQRHTHTHIYRLTNMQNKQASTLTLVHTYTHPNAIPTSLS
jgi:hypothetical protein